MVKFWITLVADVNVGQMLLPGQLQPPSATSNTYMDRCPKSLIEGNMATSDIIIHLLHITGTREGRLTSMVDILRAGIHRMATTLLQLPMDPQHIQLRLATFTVIHHQRHFLVLLPAVDIRQDRRLRATKHFPHPETM